MVKMLRLVTNNFVNLFYSLIVNTMKCFLLVGFILLVELNLFSQNTVISGKVVDDNNEVMPGASICTDNSKKYSISDFNGEFRLETGKKTNTISVSFIGYETVVIEQIDTISKPLTIVMKESVWIDSPTQSPIGMGFGVTMGFRCDITNFSFDGFESILGKYNTDVLNHQVGTANFDIACNFNRLHAGFGLGFSTNYDDDTLKIDLRNSQYALFFGYHLVNSSRWLVTPQLSFKWYRFRLINGDKDRKIPMEQYLSEKTLDVRMNQLTGFAGLHISYKFNFLNTYSPPLWTVGLYGGYIFKINNTPWIYSTANRLTTNREIGLKHFNFGITFAIHMYGF